MAGPVHNTDLQAVNHFQLSAFWMEGQGFSSFPLERQSYVFNIPGFSGDLWAQGPLCCAPTPFIQPRLLSSTGT